MAQMYDEYQNLSAGQRPLYGWTPLHDAAFSGDLKNFRHYFREAHYENPKDFFGNTPLDLALEYNHNSIVDLFRSYSQNE